MQNPMLLDACIAINLLATNCAEEIAAVLDIHFVMVRQAVMECGDLCVLDEKFVVRRGATPSDTPPLAQLLTLVESEIGAYVDLARDVDDGEAATIAIAKSRSLTMATDDRKARRVAVEMGLAMPTGTTTIVRRYAETTGLPAAKIAALLQRIRDEASYVPRHTDENFDWWQQNV